MGRLGGRCPAGSEDSKWVIPLLREFVASNAGARRTLYTGAMANCRLLIFDMDGTLVDSFPGILRALNLALGDLKMMPVDLEWVRRHVGHGASRLIASASGGRVEPGELHDLFRRHYGRVIVAESRPFPGVGDVLERLQASHVLALASNKPDAWIHEVLRGLGWDHFFGSVMGPEAAGAHKPDGAMIERILEETRIERDEAILIGDMPVDAMTGKAAGIPVLGVLSGAASASELSEAGCVAILRSVAELPEWLRLRGGCCP